MTSPATFLDNLYGWPAQVRGPRRTLLSRYVLLPLALVLFFQGFFFHFDQARVYDEAPQIAPEKLEAPGTTVRIEGQFVRVATAKRADRLCLSSEPSGPANCPVVKPNYRKLGIRESSLIGQPGYGFKLVGSRTITSLYTANGTALVSPTEYANQVRRAYRLWLNWSTGALGLLLLSVVLQLSIGLLTRKSAASTIPP